MAEFGPTPPSTLSLLQQGGQAIAQIPQNDYAHPLVEKYVRAIASGQMTSEQAHQAIQQDIVALQNPQPSLGAMPPQPAPQAQPQTAPQPRLAAPPPIESSLAGAPGAGQPMVQPAPQAATPAPQIAPQAAPQAAAPQAPMPNPGNAGPAPGLGQMFGTARNQEMGAMTAAQPLPQRQEVAPTAVEPQVAAPAKPSGAQAARDAILGTEGGRMTNKDVAVFMDAYVKGGKPALELAKEAGKNERAAAGRGVKMRLGAWAHDDRRQAMADRWEQQVAGLGFKEQQEADKVAMHLSDLEIAISKLHAAASKAAATGYDRIELQRMKDSAAEVRALISVVGRLGTSLKVDTPEVQQLINDSLGKASEATRNADAISNFAVATQSNPNAPASDHPFSDQDQPPTPRPSGGVTAGQAAGVPSKAKPIAKPKVR